MEINRLISERRKILHLTLEDIARHVGVSKSTVKKWESGYIKNMKRDKMSLLAEILKISPIDLLGGNISSPLTKQNFSSFSVAEEIVPYGKKVTETDLNKMLTSGGILMFGDKKLTEEQKKVLLSVAAAMVKEDSDA